MSTDILQKYADPYLLTAPAVLGSLHKNLMDIIGCASSDKPSSDILVVGCSKWALPYSLNPENVGSIVGDGKLILMDYSDQMVEGALKNLTDMKFAEQSGLKLPSEIITELDPLSLENRSLAIVKSDLKDPFPFPDRSFDFLDATLVVHHAIPFQQCLQNILGEFYRIQKNSSTLHYGTGKVDMDSESRIISIAKDIQDFLGAKVTINDYRDPLHCLQGNISNDNFTASSQSNSDHIYLSSEGYVKMEAYPGIVDFLLSKGYCVRKEEDDNNMLTVPIIDQRKDSDFVEQVGDFYRAILQSGLKGKYDDPTVLSSFIQAVRFEEENASRGIIEFYCAYPKIFSAMKQSGYSTISSRKADDSPFYNITAIKRELI
jgi:SAM-dependent methyltransferase